MMKWSTSHGKQHLGNASFIIPDSAFRLEADTRIGGRDVPTVKHRKEPA